MYAEALEPVSTISRNLDNNQGRHASPGRSTGSRAGITDGALGLNMATGPAEELDREIEDNRALTTFISPTD